MLRFALVLSLLAAAPHYQVGCECAGEPGGQPGREWTAGAGSEGTDAGMAGDAGAGGDGGADGGAVLDAGAPGGDAGPDACGGCPADFYCDGVQCLPCCAGVPPLCTC